MKRGPIYLDKNQIENILNYLSCVEANLFLIKKIQSAKHSLETINKILLSEEEAEVIIDSLPIPSDRDTEELRITRSKLQTFINQLRFS